MPDSIRVRANGVEFRVLSRGSGAPIVLLHGFTGRADSWVPVADELARDFRVVAIDLIGHGESDAPDDPARYNFDLAITDLAAISTLLGIDRAVWLGYSMGGRLALGLALDHPELVAALVLESATAGIQNEIERAMRRMADEALATQIEANGIESFVNEWESLPLWSSQRSLALEKRLRQRELRLRNRPHGLANSLRGMGQGAQPSFWEQLTEIDLPVLLVAGNLDTRYSGIAEDLHVTIPDAHVVLVPGAGHAVHLECPTTVVETVKDFLARLRCRESANHQEAMR